MKTYADPEEHLSKADAIDSQQLLKKNERLIKVVRRHPFGLIKYYFIVIVGFFAAFFLFYVLISDSTLIDSSGIYEYLLLSIIIAVVAGMFLVVVTMVYNQTKLIITNENLIQLHQSGLFRRRISHIFLGDIEDVSSFRPGFISQVFNFGNLRVDTESEQRNFILIYCPDVDRIAKIIRDAKDAYIDEHSNSNN